MTRPREGDRVRVHIDREIRPGSLGAALDGLEGIVKVSPDEWAPSDNRYDVLHTCSVVLGLEVQGVMVHDYFTLFEHELEVLGA